MRNATLCFLCREKPANQLLLGLKKRGFGLGKFNGFGGKIEGNETVEEAVLRELHEESGIRARIGNIKKVGELTFIFPAVPKEKGWDQIVHVFLLDKWEGEPIESEEMKPSWFDIKNLPFERMWQDDQHWLPIILQDRKVKATFVFKDDNETIQKMIINEIDNF